MLATEVSAQPEPEQGSPEVESEPEQRASTEAEPDQPTTAEPDQPTTVDPALVDPAPIDPPPQHEPSTTTVDADRLASEAMESTLGVGWLSKMRIHGFVSEGAFISTANQYIGESERGSLKMFESGLSISVEPLDQLRIGVQLVTRYVGTLSEDTPRLDWAVMDYRVTQWLGIRAGLIKLPIGLYNEFADIDSGRNAILLPHSLYPVRNRDALIAYIGLALYGSLEVGAVGELDYEAWVGTLSIPRSALTLPTVARLDSVDARYVAGARLFWRPPIEGLRLGVTHMQALIDFYITLDAAITSQVIMAKLVPEDFNGQFSIFQDGSIWVGSIEYLTGDWLFAAEYMRSFKYQAASITTLSPTLDDDAERFYGLVNFRISRHLELGTYYSVVHAAAHDRLGKSDRFKQRFHAFQRDLALTVRIDINDHWLCKLEGHFIDGSAELQTTVNQDPTRYWGLFLFRTTVTF